MSKGTSLGRAVVILNRRAGSAGSLEPLGECVSRAVRARGLVAETRIVEPDALGEALGGISAGSVELLVVGGGDGTLRSAAARAVELGITLAVLPLGTMNLVAKDLGVPLDAEAAAESLAAATCIEVDVGEVNGQVFLHSAAVGIVPRMGRVREESRASPGGMLDLMRDMSKMILRERAMRARIEFEGEAVDILTFMVAVSANRLRASAISALARESLQEGELGLYWATHIGRSGLLQLLGELGSGLWGLDERVERRSTREVMLSTRRRNLLVSIDGEPVRMAAPLRFAVRPSALRVLVPPAEEVRADGTDA
ncbi:MAG: hypothetical protein IPJ41_07815 [Phycisphaerales bacterium]|nr:hypothetical protein [Phycisphaerales bacterium]